MALQQTRERPSTLRVGSEPTVSCRVYKPGGGAVLLRSGISPVGAAPVAGEHAENEHLQRERGDRGDLRDSNGRLHPEGADYRRGLFSIPHGSLAA